MATEVGALPDDALAGVFRGLPLRSLAVARCVCKAWRDVVDARALLLPHLHLLPRAVRGLFINYLDRDHHHHFARPCSPSTVPRVDGTLSFLPNDVRRRLVSVLNHCNGLLLLCGGETAGPSLLCVCNPATRRWTVLPRWWEEGEAYHERRDRYAGAYIAFDPAESPEYQAVLVPAVPKAVRSPPPEDDHWMAAEEQRRALLLRQQEKVAPFCLDWFFSLPEDGTAAVGQWEFEQLSPFDLQQCDRGFMEWPPALWKLRVFSSSTGQWEDRIFVREGMPAGTVGGMRSVESHYRPRRRYAVYHHGSLYVYVHCRRSFVTRLSLSKSKYQIIEMPVNVDEYTKPYLGKLQNGICFGIVHDHQLKIWILNESCGQMEWVLKYETVVGHYAEYLASMASDDRRHDGSWTVEENNKTQDTDHDVASLSDEENIKIQDTGHDVESLSGEGHEWDSDNDDTFTINTESQEYINDHRQHLNIIGFHPYKEVVFMVRGFHVVAYHLNSTKIQYLGNSHPKYCYHHSFWNGIDESFLYTPCMIGDLLDGDHTGGQRPSED